MTATSPRHERRDKKQWLHESKVAPGSAHKYKYAGDCNRKGDRTITSTGDILWFALAEIE